jgi:uncharacterized membrane protein (DUF485 family)
MPTRKFKFKNSGDLEYNDVVYGKTFTLERQTFSFTIEPKNTRFWRFGMRLSMSKEIPFFHPNARHKQNDLIDIHLAVGEFDGKSWNSPNRLQLGQYNLTQHEHVISRSDFYLEMGRVQWKVVFFSGDTEYDQFSMELLAPGVEPLKNTLAIPRNYKYFQLFAWADKSEFELDCLIKYDFQDKIDNARSDRSLTYWLLKINSESFNLPSFNIGKEVWFGAYNTKFQRRPDYEMFRDVKKGDAVIGYSFNGQKAVIWNMEVGQSLHRHEQYGECIRLRITRVVDPPISLESVKSLLPEKLLLDMGNNPLRLLPISKEIYEVIMATKGIDKKKVCFLPSYNTEGRHKTTEDQLEFEYDIEAIASVMSLKEINPPLAIGLFGNWGSGKSFLMEKIKDKIERYTSANDSRYVKHVVPVMFNSWHYCDANLWASLITEIFESLKNFSKKQDKEDEIRKLSSVLKSTSFERENIIQKKKELQLKVNQLEKDRQKKRDKLQDLLGLELLKRIFTDTKIREDLSELNNTHIEQILTDSETVQEYIDEVNDSKNKAIFFFRELIKLQGWRWKAVLSIAIIVFFVVYTLKIVFPDFWQSFTFQGSVMTSIIVSGVSKIVMTIRPYSKTLKQALERLNSLKNTFDTRQVAESSELVEKKREFETLRKRLEEIDIKIDLTKSEIKDILSGKRLADFIEQRSVDKNYTNQLGVISWIRKDFAMLDKLLREQHLLSEEERKGVFNPQQVSLQIDRIVLYIDDLDRCNEDVVLKVLEAIHLLLAFPLFVVIVGVDPRWLNNALNHKLGTLMTGLEQDDEIDDNSRKAVTSYDYLEKIFQIPFAIKPITAIGREQLIEYLMVNELEQIDYEGSQGENDSDSETLMVIPQAETSIFTNTSVQENRNGSDQQKDNAPIRLVFKVQELEFIKILSPIFGETPRSINRFINIYRIIKSHRSLIVSDPEISMEYYPVLILLALVVGKPDITTQFFAELRMANDELSFIEFVRQVKFGSFFSDWLGRDTQFFYEEIEPLKINVFKRNADLVSRFSFRGNYI